MKENIFLTSLHLLAIKRLQTPSLSPFSAAVRMDSVIDHILSLHLIYFILFLFCLIIILD